jgi:hypothetical protein
MGEKDREDVFGETACSLYYLKGLLSMKGRAMTMLHRCCVGSLI